MFLLFSLMFSFCFSQAQLVQTPFGIVDESLSLKQSARPHKIAMGTGVVHSIWSKKQKFWRPAGFSTNRYNLYRSTLLRHYNRITLTNEMQTYKTQSVRGQFDFRDAEEVLDFAEKRNLKVTGHALVWFKFNPDWMEKITNPLEMKTEMKNRIKTIMGHFDQHYPGVVTDYIVVNEPINDRGEIRKESPFYKINPSDKKPYDYIHTAFLTAHRANPNANLYLNDYNISRMNEKSNKTYEMVQNLLARGTPIHGIGFQGHITVDASQSPITNAPTEAELVANFRRFARLGLKIKITELDVRLNTQLIDPSLRRKQFQLQAKIFHRYTRACLKVKACIEITTWEFNNGDSWIPRTYKGFGKALLFNEDLSKRSLPFNAVSAALQNFGL